MKMLKKAAAVLLAAAMSLVMLTACGGGSGSTTQYKLAKVLAESQQTGKLYMDVTSLDTTIEGKPMDIKLAQDNKAGKMILGMGTEGKVYTMYMTTADGVGYEISGDEEETYWKKVSGEPMIAVAGAAVPSQTNLSKLKVNTAYEYAGKTYYAEILTSDSTEVAYCFEGDTLKYIVVKQGSYTYAERVNAISAKFPDKITDGEDYSYEDAMNLPIKG